MGREILRGLCICAAVACCTLGLVAGTAAANTVTVGSSLTAPGFSLSPFGPPATVTNYLLPAPATAASPVDGTVISWRFIGAGGPLTPRVLRSTGGTSMTGAGTGAPQNATAPNVISGPFSTALPIKRGQFFGVNGASGASLSTAPTSGATSLYFDPALVDEGSGQAPTGTNPEEDAISATVRYCLVPKLKGKTGKAARQALRAADCTVGSVRKGKKRRPTKSVLSQSVKAGTSISDTQPVDLRISRKKKR
jgi:PASTA domain-containing protein